MWSANDISTLMSGLRSTHGLRHVGPLVIEFLLSASTFHLLNWSSETASKHLRQAMEALQEISTYHFLAGTCLSIVRAQARRWHIDLPWDTPSATDSHPSTIILSLPQYSLHLDSNALQNLPYRAAYSNASQGLQSIPPIDKNPLSALYAPSLQSYDLDAVPPVCVKPYTCSSDANGKGLIFI